MWTSVHTERQCGPAKQSVKAWTEWVAKTKRSQELDGRWSPRCEDDSNQGLDRQSQSQPENKKRSFDVRESEWDAGHLKDAQLLPLSQLTAGSRPPNSPSCCRRTRPSTSTAVRAALDAAEILRKECGEACAGYADLLKAGFEKAAN